jgi:hypothetical protein
VLAVDGGGERERERERGKGSAAVSAVVTGGGGSVVGWSACSSSLSSNDSVALSKALDKFTLSIQTVSELIVSAHTL